MKRGAFRLVFLIGNVAIKFPRFKNFNAGLRCNRWEREMWREWRPVFRWTSLCPVLFADPFGFFVVMPKAKQPVSSDQAISACGDFYPAVNCEMKPQDYGFVGSDVLVLDYGLPWQDMVKEQREYYQRVRSFEYSN